MRKMGSSSAIDISAMQEIMLEFHAGKMVFDGKKFVPDSRKGLIRIGRGDEGLLHLQWLDRNLNAVEDVSYNVAALSCCLVEFLDEEKPVASTPFQAFEDMLEDNISSRTGNLVVPDLGAEVMNDVNSSSEPVRLEDLQRILSNIGSGGSSGDPDEGNY
uniref:Pru domain-containing protein n=3 Tax=Populus TaxID=3689 RepID=A0A2K1R8V2_POPTR